MSLLKRISHKLRKRPFLTSFVVVILVIAGILIANSNKKPEIKTTEVRRGTISQEVSVTGKTVPVQNIELSFEKGGKVSGVYAQVGDLVYSGQILVQLDAVEISAQLEQQKANLATQVAKLDALKRGSRPEDILVKETELEKAVQDLKNDYAGIIDILQDAYAKADDAVNKQIKSMFTTDSPPQLSFTTNNYQTKTDAEIQKLAAEKLLEEWQDEISLLASSSPEENLDLALVKAEANLEKIRSLLSTLMEATNSTITITDATASTYLTNIGTARTNINTAGSAINTQRQTIASQKITVRKIQNELDLKRAGSDPEDIKAQEAQVEQAKASVTLYEVQLEKMYLRSSISGTVTKQDAKIGQIIAANSPIVSVISQNRLQIEANIPEVDIEKVSVGQAAELDFDALPTEIFSGEVSYIDPGETVIEGVVTYKTTFTLKDGLEKVKSGMSADIDILTEKKTGVLVLPQRVVFSEGGDSYVYIPGENGSEKRLIETGLKGSDGNIEIISGLAEGERVVLSPNE